MVNLVEAASPPASHLRCESSRSSTGPASLRESGEKAERKRRESGEKAERKSRRGGLNVGRREERLTGLPQDPFVKRFA